MPTAVLGGAGLVIFGMVAATGIRILSAFDFESKTFNLFIAAISLGVGMIPLIAPKSNMWMPHIIEPLIGSGILLAAFAAILLNVFFNGAAPPDEDELKEAAMATEGAH